MRPPLGLRPSTLAYLAVAVLASAPAWIVKHPPLQDAPFHMATLKVIHDFNDPALHLADFYRSNLGGTQYVFTYLLGSVLAYVVGVPFAHAAISCLYLGGTPLALRQLLRALGKDERLSLFAIPMLVNAMFTLGFLPYLLGIPIMFWGLAVGLDYLLHPRRATGLFLGALSTILFFTHVFPFALFGVGYAALFPWERPRAWLRAAVPVVPSVAAAAWWTFFASAGKSSAGGLSALFLREPDLGLAFAEIPNWTFNVFRDTSDEATALLLLLVAVTSYALAQGDPDTSRPASRAYVVLPIVCGFLYFFTGDQLGDVWLVAKRFAVPGMLASIPLLRMPRGARGAAVTVGLLAVAIHSTVNVCTKFIRYERREVGDIDDALAVMEPGKKVAGLIFDRGSLIVNNSPFLHYVSHYQAEKGGFVQFSYAHFKHWPFSYKDGFMPPPGRPPFQRWEWMPESVVTELYPFYDYVLVRGPGFYPKPNTYHVKYQGDHWVVYERDAVAQPSPVE
ncbi:MAG: hypothetical protein IPF92_08110 [Myxococcales bacterium]|nr:hypothetical protein [Myxococcales bacterium]